MDIRKTASDQEIYYHYLEKFKKVDDEVSDFKKNAFLMSKDLCKLVESKQGEANTYLDPKDGKYWKKVPIKVTNEEFLEIKTLSEKREGNASLEYSKPAAKTVGYAIIIVGFLLAIIISGIPFIGMIYAVMVGISSFLFGLLYITLGNTITSIDRVYDSVERIRINIEKEKKK